MLKLNTRRWDDGLFIYKLVSQAYEEASEELYVTLGECILSYILD